MTRFNLITVSPSILTTLRLFLHVSKAIVALSNSGSCSRVVSFVFSHVFPPTSHVERNLVQLVHETPTQFAEFCSWNNQDTTHNCPNV